MEDISNHLDSKRLFNMASCHVRFLSFYKLLKCMLRRFWNVLAAIKVRILWRELHRAKCSLAILLSLQFSFSLYCQRFFLSPRCSNKIFSDSIILIQIFQERSKQVIFFPTFFPARIALNHNPSKLSALPNTGNLLKSRFPLYDSRALSLMPQLLFSRKC